MKTTLKRESGVIILLAMTTLYLSFLSLLADIE
jgi:hypothetical protein